MHTQHNAQKMVLPILLLISLSHLLNDLIQAVMVSIYPMLKQNYQLSFAQIGMISLIYQITASIIQPGIGLYTDKYPKPNLLPIGMLITLFSVILLAFAPNFGVLLIAAALMGIGSATFHPEASRVARMASGGKFGTAQSLFQVGGNSGSALGPLLVALFIVPQGQNAVIWVVVFVLLALWILYKVSRWVKYEAKPLFVSSNHIQQRLHGKLLARALLIIALLMLAKFIYIASLSNYFTFYLMEKFQLNMATAQLYLFAFLGAVAVGTFAGGPIGDKIGRNAVIGFSFLGMAPFALLMPNADLFWTIVCAIFAGFIMSSAFSAMVVYAQEAVPGRVGLISGTMFGLMFGIGGLSAAVLGFFADEYGLDTIFNVCAYLPLLGFAALGLPKRNI
ncbi:Fosmidomycin resistance protein [Mannheimia varigena]|uniref:MFS transporter n=1 Tax=Mannheimia varigena TaxID=85404 RepID=UPI00159D1E5F|nr:MFS transporter [Mannheimia varigena]QLB17298.1 Fosmidomycin resistance protein [Mannheimia varigena]